LARHRGSGEADGDHRQKNGLHHSPANAKSGLRRGAEVADDPVNHRGVHAHQQKLAARGQADVRHLLPDAEPRPPM